MSRGRCALGVVGAIAGVSLLLAACSGDTSTEVEGDGEQQPVDAGVAFAAVGPVLDLAVDLEQTLAEASPETDLAIAPVAVAASLAQARSGAEGDTAAALDSVLHTPPGPAGASNLASGVASLEQLLREQTGTQTAASGRSGSVSVDLTDSLWLQKGTPLAPPWLDGLKSVWGSGVRTADFRSDPETSRRAVNSWARSTTSGHIDQLAPRGSISAATRLMGAGAAYLKAPWLTAFSPNDTHLAPFRHLDGSVTTVSMMQDASLVGARHDEGDGWTAFELPYLGTLAMTIIVPDVGRFREVEQGLDGDRLADIVSDLNRGTVDLSLPKFGFTTEMPLTDALRDLGLGPAMDPATAGFSPISPEALWLTAVLHQTYLAIAEQGTEATASNPRPTGSTTSRPTTPTTSGADIGGDDTTVPPGTTGTTTTGAAADVIVVDRPFLVLVRDRTTGAPLFYGRVLSPNG